MKFFGKRKIDRQDSSTDVDERASNAGTMVDPGLDPKPKGRWERSWPTIACGAGLFSDGYVNGVIGSVNTMLKTIYGTEYTGTNYPNLISSLAFAGTVLGQLIFGYTSDHWSRKNSLMISTVILIIFSALSAGAYGAGGSTSGLFAALTAYRFLLGIGIGGEYPAGSVGCAENTNDLKAGHRNRWFIFFTNFAIDAGFVIAALVPMIVVLIFGQDHLRACWRICLGLGVIPPLSLLYLRLKLQEPESYKKNKMSNYPYWLIFKYYWPRLAVVSLIWFTYDFSAYSFGLYSSEWISIILSADAPLWKSFGWNTLVNFFYIPGSFLGAFASDWIGPKRTLTIGVIAQGCVGFIMAGVYQFIDTEQYVAGFICVYGCFIALGEFGPGDNIGLLASKLFATSIRGSAYSCCAAAGKVGAFAENRYQRTKSIRPEVLPNYGKHLFLSTQG